MLVDIVVHDMVPNLKAFLKPRRDRMTVPKKKIIYIYIMFEGGGGEGGSMSKFISRHNLYITIKTA